MILNIKRMQVVVWGGKDFLCLCLVSLIAWWLNIQTRRYSDHFQLSDPPLSPNLPQCVKEVRAGVTPPHHCCFHNTLVAARRSRGLINPLIAPINPNTLELIRGEWQSSLSSPKTASECQWVSAGCRKWCQGCQQLIFTSAGSCSTPTDLTQVFDLINVQVRPQQTCSWWR